jgi:hypothetical protein
MILISFFAFISICWIAFFTVLLVQKIRTYLHKLSESNFEIVNHLTDELQMQE